MVASFKTYLETHFPFLKKSQLLVACSGGLDSVVLLHLLKLLRYDVAIAHCNFALRGTESDEDARFVEELANTLGVVFYSETFNTEAFAKKHKMSTQMAARELRYAWFAELQQAHSYQYVLTAHHSDDDLETFFINLSRGTGLRGLTGIPAVNETTVRPLLAFSRSEILAYAKQEQLFWREDSSNAKTDYLRNTLRHDAIPKFKGVSEKTLENFRRTQHHLKQSQSLVEDYMALIYNLVVAEVEDGYQINIDKLLELPNTDALLYELLHPFNFTNFKDVYNLLSAQTGKVILSGTHRLLRNRNHLLLTKRSENLSNTEFFIKKNENEINNPIHLRFIPTDKIGNIENTTVYVDAAKLTYPLVLRKWQEGDVFHPFGMKGKKKLSKFFKDEKLSLVAKQKVWLLCSADKIVWVIGYRLDNRFKVTSTTEQLLKITHQQ